MPIYTLKFVNKREVARETYLYEFNKPEGFNFKAGQYGGFTLINPGETDAGGITRRFSLFNAPDDTTIQVATRIQNTAYKRVLNSMQIGAEIKFAGPTGNFILHEDSSIPAVLIAGGIGITPFHSMIRDATLRKSTQPIILFYGNQSRNDAAFLDELTQLEKENPNFKLIATMANPIADWQGETGFITHTMIKKYVPDISIPVFYVCGSPVMVTALQETLVEMGIDENNNIKIEDFPGY